MTCRRRLGRRAACAFAASVLAGAAAAQPVKPGPGGAPGQDVLVDQFAPGQAAPAGPASAGGESAAQKQARGLYPPLERRGLPVGEIQDAWNKAEPAPGQQAPGVLRFSYEKGRVYPIRTRDQMVTLIVLPPTEAIEDHYLGDERIFRVLFDSRRPNVIQVRHNNPGADTNLVLITGSGRVLTFYVRGEGWNAPEVNDLTVFIEGMPQMLLTRKARSGAVPPGRKPNARLPPGGAHAAPAKPDYLRHIPFDINELRWDDYEIKAQLPGDALIAPERVFHDGRFTFFDFGTKADQVERPVVHMVVDGVDTPVNTRTRGPVGNILIAEAVGNFTLRAGKRVVCVLYRGRYSSPPARPEARLHTAFEHEHEVQ